MIAEVGELRGISREREIELAKRKDEGDINARNELVESVLPMAFKAVAAKCKQANCPGHTEDMYQEVVGALMNAADKFSWTIGARFTTYSRFWIRQACDRYLMYEFRRPDRLSLEHRSTDDEWLECPLVDDSRGPEEHAEWRCEVEKLRRKIGRLPEPERDVVRSLLRGESFRQIAARRGLTRYGAQLIEQRASAKLVRRYGQKGKVRINRVMR